MIFQLSFQSTWQAALSWFSNEERRRGALLAVQVAPFAGITCLWFITVIRDLLGAKVPGSGYLPLSSGVTNACNS